MRKARNPRRRPLRGRRRPLLLGCHQALEGIVLEPNLDEDARDYIAAPDVGGAGVELDEVDVPDPTGLAADATVGAVGIE